MAKMAPLAMMGQQKNQGCVPRQTMTEIFRSMPSFKLIKIDQDVPVYHRHVDFVQKT